MIKIWCLLKKENLKQNYMILTQVFNLINKRTITL